MINKIEILKKIYTIFDKQVESFSIACKHFCSDCCTDRIWMTSIEGELIIDYLRSKNDLSLLDKITNIPEQKRYHPKTTTNMEAKLSVEDAPIPAPEDNNLFQTCPLLTNNECPIYDVRPMACRSMISTIPCKNKGYAEMPPISMTISTVLSQYIEHIDINGYYGNYKNIFEYLTSSPDSMSIQHVMATEKLLPNQKIKYLMIPPEHRTHLQKIMKEIEQNS